MQARDAEKTTLMRCRKERAVLRQTIPFRRHDRLRIPFLRAAQGRLSNGVRDRANRRQAVRRMGDRVSRQENRPRRIHRLLPISSLQLAQRIRLHGRRKRRHSAGNVSRQRKRGDRRERIQHVEAAKNEKIFHTYQQFK